MLLWVIAILIIGLLLYKPSVITEALTNMGISIPQGWSNIGHHGFTNTCVTKKPYGFPSHANMYNYWKDRPKSWAIEYSKERIRGNIDMVRSNNEISKATLGSLPATVSSSSVHQEYYHDPLQYCKKNPSVYPCPNHWIPLQERVEYQEHVSGDMSKPVPSLLKGDFGHVKDKDINDNYHMRVIQSGKEDHGLCGNNFPTTQIIG